MSLPVVEVAVRVPEGGDAESRERLFAALVVLDEDRVLHGGDRRVALEDAVIRRLEALGVVVVVR